jgi:hypothetical protein
MFGTGARHDIIHNISKIQLHRTCIFGDTTDLGFHISIFHATTIRKNYGHALKKL